MAEAIGNGEKPLKRELQDGINGTREQVQILLLNLESIEALGEKELSEEELGELNEVLSAVFVGVKENNRELTRVKKEVFGEDVDKSEEVSRILELRFNDGRKGIRGGAGLKLPEAVLSGNSTYPGVLKLVEDGMSIDEALGRVLDTIYKDDNPLHPVIFILNKMITTG